MPVTPEPFPPAPVDETDAQRAARRATTLAIIFRTLADRHFTQGTREPGSRQRWYELGQAHGLRTAACYIEEHLS